MKTFRIMLKTELKLSLRGMDMVIFAICVPFVVLVILGVVYGNEPAFEGAEYTLLEESFSALATISICAGGVMGLTIDSMLAPIMIMSAIALICIVVSLKCFKWE